MSLCAGVTAEDLSHLAVEHALLFQTQILRSVGHDGEGGFGIMPARKEENNEGGIMERGTHRQLSIIITIIKYFFLYLHISLFCLIIN